jgi:ribonuclease D
MNRAILLKQDITDDIRDEFKNCQELAVDCEMMGLNPFRDRLCLVQIANENGSCVIVQIDEKNPPKI